MGMMSFGQSSEDAQNNDEWRLRIKAAVASVMSLWML